MQRCQQACQAVFFFTALGLHGNSQNQGVGEKETLKEAGLWRLMIAECRVFKALSVTGFSQGNE